MRSACGNSIVADKGFRRPNPNRFVRRIANDPIPSPCLRALADQLYREDHGD